MIQRLFFFKNNKELESLDEALLKLKDQLLELEDDTDLWKLQSLSDLYNKLEEHKEQNPRGIFNVTEATLNLLSNLSKKDSSPTIGEIFQQFSDECNRIPVNASCKKALMAFILSLLLVLIFSLFLGALGVYLGSQLLGTPGAVAGGISMILLGTFSGIITAGTCVIEHCPQPSRADSYLEQDLIDAINLVHERYCPTA